MMRHVVTLFVCAAALLASPAALPAQNKPTVEVTDEAIDQAIDRAIAWLWTQQEPDGKWPYKEAPDGKGAMRSINGSRWPPGEHCMAMMALEYAGTPLSDERFKKGLKVLLEFELQHNYMISCRLVTLAHLYHRSEKDKRGVIRQVMKKDVDLLVANQGSIGGWRYTTPPIPPRAIDFSNTQLCVLALSEAAKCGIEVPVESMLRAHQRIIADQRDDGGWNYGCWTTPGAENEHSYGNMTAACVASLFLTNEFLTGGLGCPCKSSKSSRGKDIVGDSLKRGMEWLNREFLPDTSPKGYHYYYWIYQAERVGIATGYRYFGTHDWYREICSYLLPKQDGAGAFGTTVDTSFAILFLVKGRAPILYNKLQYEGDWDLHAFDMKNLVGYMGLLKEQQIAWQVIQSSTPVELWYDAPVLFITTETQFEVTDDLKKKLRAFTDGGGTLLLEASCGNSAAKSIWQNLAKEVWPEWELERIDKDHPVWETDSKLRSQRPNLMHMSDGIRSIIFYSPTDISCLWHTNAVTKNEAMFQFGMNLAAYASDKGKLRKRLTGSRIVAGQGLEDQTIAGGGKAEVKVGQVAHGGDWYVGRNYASWPLLTEFLKEKASLTLAVQPEVDVAAEMNLGQFDLLWLKGRQGLSLTDAAKAKLKSYLAGGGFLVAESIMGDTRFTEAFTAAAGEMGLMLKPLSTKDAPVTGQLGGAKGYDLTAKIRFSRALAVQRIGKNYAELTGLYLGDKLVGVHSPYDVLYSLTGCRSYDRLGYEPDEAMAVAANLVLLRSAASDAGGTQTE
ncbi:MAG: DUF4159 domain-containing protein [Planctomycetes bacterium]|nr:DUF4159 domain-containing protein [Planctomycetota bacterium]